MTWCAMTNATPHRTAQHSAARHSTARHGTAQHATQRTTAQHVTGPKRKHQKHANVACDPARMSQVLFNLDYRPSALEGRCT